MRYCLGMQTETIANLLALHVIVLTIGGHVAYVAREGATFDGSWFTRDLGEAKTYKLARNAVKRIAEHGAAWNDMAPRVVAKSSI